MSFNPHPSRRTGATEDDAHTLPPNAFQSSPVPEDGCNSWAGTCLWWAGMFQSSPVPEDGCNGRPARPRGRGRGGFNPHPSRRTGATGVEFSVNLGGQFQSSPVPEDGCNAPSGYSTTPSCGFQSSPVPEDGCN